MAQSSTTCRPLLAAWFLRGLDDCEHGPAGHISLALCWLVLFGSWSPSFGGFESKPKGRTKPFWVLVFELLKMKHQGLPLEIALRPLQKSPPRPPNRPSACPSRPLGRQAASGKRQAASGKRLERSAPTSSLASLRAALPSACGPATRAVERSRSKPKRRGSANQSSKRCRGIFFLHRLGWLRL